MPEAAFLLPFDAARLFASGKRKVLVLSYGWLSAAEADPYGSRLAMLRTYIGSLKDADECGLFIDQVCLPQPPRTKEEDEVFFKGLAQMGSLYASVTGTTVLMQREVPPRPSAYDGKIRLFDVAKDLCNEAAMEAALRNDLSRFGSVTDCEIRPALVELEAGPGRRIATVKAASSSGVASVDFPARLAMV